VNAHGTGTAHNDGMESRALREVFPDGVPVVSTKGYTGHTLGGAGATELALAIYMMDAGFIAPCLGAEPVDPRHGIEVVTTRREARLRRVLSNSFAFGGNNISVCLRAP
jgi:3-oxoacyl-[acyl-carrier-protein] synthase-1